VEYQALLGDAVDNIPGVAGVGEKTAAALMLAHGSLAGVLDAAAAGAVGPARAAKALAAPGAADAARLSLQLARLCSGVEHPALARAMPAWQLRRPEDGGAQAVALMRQLEFVSLARRVTALWA
jgi:5'-3' exonuclease